MENERGSATQLRDNTHTCDDALEHRRQRGERGQAGLIITTVRRQRGRQMLERAKTIEMTPSSSALAAIVRRQA